MIDLGPLLDAARDRMGDILRAYGARVAGSAAKGRATCRVHDGDGLNVSYGAGFITCHSACGGKTWDALGFVAEREGLDLRIREDLALAAERLAGILGRRLEDGPSPRPRAPRPVAARPAPAPTVDAAARWDAIADRDDEGEAYLRGRGLPVDPLPGFVRFNRGSADPWLAAREHDGFVVAFGAFRVDGTLATISLRCIRPEGPPAGMKKTLALRGASTAGAAIGRPELALLATGDPEFARDEVVLVEGGPDALAATAAFDRAALEAALPPTWALGAIGCTAAPATLRAFAPALRGRTVHVALDADPAGEEWAEKAIAAAWEAGASHVTRLRPPAGKDLAEFIAGRAA